MTRGFVFLVLTVTALAQAPPDAEIKKILVDRIDNQKQGVGIVVGVVEPTGRRVVAYGRAAKGAARPLDGDTIFEIGSITKVFTSLVLADMAQRKEVALSDPVAKFLPKDVKVPERGGRTITLLDLSTQTSGLPRMPNNFKPKNPSDPYVDYTPKLLYEFLGQHELRRDIGEKYEYSNIGVGLLGHALSNRAGVGYGSMVVSRICNPLDMNSTRVMLTPELQARLATGHDQGLSPVANWNLDAIAGAGALRSSANDMLVFLAAVIGYTKGALTPAIATMLTPRRPTGMPNMDIAMGWHIAMKDGAEIVWHNGGTGGYRTFAGYNPKTRVGVVALSNTSNQRGVDDIGMHLLDSRFELAKPVVVKERKQITLDPNILERYVGQYQLAPTFVLTITREENRLFAQATGQPKFEVFAEAEREFFLKVVDAQVTFEVDGEKATQLVLHQNGRDMPGKRVEP